MRPPVDVFLVIHEYTCVSCDGSGRIYDEQWREANRAYDAARDAFPCPDVEATEDEYYTARAAANDAGYDAIRKFWKERGYYIESRWPPEDYACAECEGTGIVRKETPLIDAIKVIQEAA